jgi:hypothetical protein
MIKKLKIFNPQTNKSHKSINSWIKWENKMLSSNKNIKKVKNYSNNTNKNTKNLIIKWIVYKNYWLKMLNHKRTNK